MRSCCTHLGIRRALRIRSNCRSPERWCSPTLLPLGRRCFVGLLKDRWAYSPPELSTVMHVAVTFETSKAERHYALQPRFRDHWRGQITHRIATDSRTEGM